MDTVVEILRKFLERGDYSVSAARELEGQLGELPEEEIVEDLIDMLASYRPGGGEYLYDRAALEKEILTTLESIDE